MSEEQIKCLIYECREHLLTDGKIDERVLLWLCKEIERTTRHRAHASAQAAANAISCGLDVREAVNMLEAKHYAKVVKGIAN